MLEPATQKQNRRETVRRLLEDRDKAGIWRWAQEDRSPWRILNPLTLETDPLIRWRAIEAIGWIAAWKIQVGDGSLEPVRDMLRRLLWGMNDESGNSHWSAPDVIAEILVNVPELISEFAAPLLDHRDSEPYRRGVIRAVARIAAAKSNPFVHLTESLTQSLRSADPMIRGCSLLALAHISRARALLWLQNPEHSASWRGDSEPFQFYDFHTGSLQNLTLARIGEEILTQRG